MAKVRHKIMATLWLLIVGFLASFSAFGLSLGKSKPYARVLISSDGAKVLQAQTEEPTIIDYYKEHPFLKSRFEIEKLEDLPENEQREIRVKPQVYGAKSGNSHDPTPAPQVIIRPISTRQPQVRESPRIIGNQLEAFGNKQTEDGSRGKIKTKNPHFKTVDKATVAFNQIPKLRPRPMLLLPYTPSASLVTTPSARENSTKGLLFKTDTPIFPKYSTVNPVPLVSTQSAPTTTVTPSSVIVANSFRFTALSNTMKTMTTRTLFSVSPRVATSTPLFVVQTERPQIPTSDPSGFRSTAPEETAFSTRRKQPGTISTSTSAEQLVPISTATTSRISPIPTTTSLTGTPRVGVEIEPTTSSPSVVNKRPTTQSALSIIDQFTVFSTQSILSPSPIGTATQITLQTSTATATPITTATLRTGSTDRPFTTPTASTMITTTVPTTNSPTDISIATTTTITPSTILIASTIATSISSTASLAPSTPLSATTTPPPPTTTTGGAVTASTTMTAAPTATMATTPITTSTTTIRTTITTTTTMPTTTRTRTTLTTTTPTTTTPTTTTPTTTTTTTTTTTEATTIPAVPVDLTQDLCLTPLRTCDQSITARGLPYERSLEILQNEEYLEATDLGVVRRRFKRGGCAGESEVVRPNMMNIGMGTAGLIGIAGLASLVMTPPAAPPPPPPVAAAAAAAGAAGAAGAAAVATAVGLAPANVPQPGTPGGGGPPVPDSPTSILALSLVPAGLSPVAVFPPFTNDRTNTAVGVIFSESDATSLASAGTGNRRFLVRRRFRRQLPATFPWRIRSAWNNLQYRLGRKVEGITKFNQKIKNKIRDKIFGPPVIEYYFEVPETPQKQTVERVYGLRVLVTVVSEPCILGVTCDMDGNKLVAGVNATNPELAESVQNLDLSEFFAQVKQNASLRKNMTQPNTFNNQNTFNSDPDSVPSIQSVNSPPNPQPSSESDLPFIYKRFHSPVYSNHIGRSSKEDPYLDEPTNAHQGHLDDMEPMQSRFSSINSQSMSYQPRQDEKWIPLPSYRTKRQTGEEFESDAIPECRVETPPNCT